MTPLLAAWVPPCWTWLSLSLSILLFWERKLCHWTYFCLPYHTIFSLFISLFWLHVAIGGDLPYDINGCRELERFDVSNNFLTGKLPGAFARLSNITDLNLSSNTLQGPITMVTELNKLCYLNVSHNKFDGKLPNLESLFFLAEVRLNDNHFGGPLPDSVTTLENMTILEVQV